ncbi:unnamed protein product [Candidula unifasciata]|uniref:PH domain-containing protein n=1 Tax=Candidula unifasciata TaxID=100452 RepID=A0A8S4A1S7_9EUPU|nr:unnamed protein product [Candidula unifasciata]
MDPETQKLIEKTRQRREILNQRIAGMPEAAPRKRRTPVHEQEPENVLTEKQINKDDSPKRQCVREGEQEKKQDTPAIRGVQSRIRDLPNSLTRENEENMEGSPTPKPRKSISSPPLERRAPTSLSKSPARDGVAPAGVSSSRKGRFAALASQINNWEDDLTHHVIPKEEEKKPKWQPPAKVDVAPAQLKSTPSGKGPAPPPPPAENTASSVTAERYSPKKAAPAAAELYSPKKMVSATSELYSPKKTAPATAEIYSPKKTQDPHSQISASPAGSLTRNSPLRTSKVEWNRSPKPFSPSYAEGASSPSKSATDLTKFNFPKHEASPVKASSDTVVSSSTTRSDKYKTNHKASVARTEESGSRDFPEVASSNDQLNVTLDEPTLRPVSQRLASWAKKVDASKPPPVEPSRQPLSAKLASFEKKIVQNTPKTSQTRSPFVSKTPKKAVTPALSTPTASSSTSSRQKSCDPTELPVSQRMSQMQEKLSNTPQLRRQQEEPTAFTVGARMSAWENMTSSNLVSDIKKLNPVEGSPMVSKARPVSEFTPKCASLTSGPPQNPPPPPAMGKSLTSKKSFRECIEEKASQVLARKESPTESVPARVTTPAKVDSPVKTAGGSPSKICHSPSKVSAGTKTVQQRLVGRVQDSNTTCSSLAAQSRAARLAELEEIQNRWKNGVLKDDSSSSDESGGHSEPPGERARGRSPQRVNVEASAPASSKREESRNRARSEFNQKLAEIGFGGSEAASPVPPPPPLPQASSSAAKSATSTAGGSQTSSIYNLIKKREDAEPQSTDKKVQFEDSFDDTDDDCLRTVPQSAVRRQAQQLSDEDQVFKKPQVPKLRLESESDALSSSDVGEEEFVPSEKQQMDIDDDDISLKGFVSEAVRRESILPSPKLQSSSQSSLDSYDDDRMTMDSEESAASSSKHGGYVADDSNNELEDRQAVDDLLDEAFDDTSDDLDPDMDPRKVVLRKKPQQEHYYDPDMDVNNVVMRKKSSAIPKPAQRHNGCSRDSSDDDGSDRPYSLESYRKSALVHHIMEPVVRKSRYTASYDHDEEDVVMPTIQQPQRDDKRSVLDRIRELQELVQQEQSVIMQTSNALNKCCVGNSYFAGSAEQVECNRVLLLACQKRQCYMTEIQRLKDTGVLSHEGPGPQGSLTISDIRLPLKKEFVTKIGTSQDNITHYFILLIRNGPQLICTQMLSTHDPMMRGSLDFPNLIKINGITANFKLTMDIYSMSVSREMSSKDKKKKTPKKSKGYAMALESPGGPTAVRTTSFSQVTSLVLTMKCLDKNSFHLDRLPHLSPLYGQIFMRLKCLMETNVEERGFLTMFEDVSGFGAWHRRWCVLAGNKICVWKYPDDETRKDPMTLIDLKRCITEKVGLIPRDICARPNTFELTTVRQPLKGEHDTLVSRTYNSTTSVRHQMSADSKEERIVWCNKINRTLANLRTWNADALKPQKSCTTTAASYH